MRCSSFVCPSVPSFEFIFFYIWTAEYRADRNREVSDKSWQFLCCSSLKVSLKAVCYKWTVAWSWFTSTAVTATANVDNSLSSRLLGVARTLTVISGVSCRVSSLTSLSHSATTRTGQPPALCWTRLTAPRRSGRPDTVIMRRRDGRHCAGRRRLATVPFSFDSLTPRRVDCCGQPKMFLNDFLKKSFVKP